LYRALRSVRPALAALALLCAWPRATEDAPDDVPEDARALYAPHGDAHTGFFTPWSRRPRRSVRACCAGSSSRSNPYDKSHDPVIPVVANDGHALARTRAGRSFTWVGHATFAIHDGDDVILTDPIFGPRALLPARLVAAGRPAHGDARRTRSR
jgi:hypothetical protein